MTPHMVLFVAAFAFVCAGWHQAGKGNRTLSACFFLASIPLSIAQFVMVPA